MHACRTSSSMRFVRSPCKRSSQQTISRCGISAAKTFTTGGFQASRPPPFLLFLVVLSIYSDTRAIPFSISGPAQWLTVMRRLFILGQKSSGHQSGMQINHNLCCPDLKWINIQGSTRKAIDC